MVNGIGHFLAVLLLGCITDTAQCISHFLYEILQSLFFITVGQQHREVYLFFCYLAIHTLSCSVYQILVRHRFEQTSDKSCAKQFLFTHIWKGSEQTKLTYKRALIIGFIQCIAMIPGVSRSMSTIVGGMSQRLTRKAAAEFSFFLAVPTMFGATCLEVYKLISHGGGSLLTQGNNLFTLILGSVVAFIVAILAIKFFINYVTKYGFAAFGWYRIVVGLIIIICGLCGVDMQMVD